MHYCIIRSNRIIFISEKKTEEYAFNFSETSEENPEPGPMVLAMSKKLKSGEFKDFLLSHLEKFCRANKDRIYFILDNPWIDVRFVDLPPHKRNKTRQILALSLSSEFVQEIENIIFDFYTITAPDNQQVKAIVYACSKMLSETINSVCVQASVIMQGILPYTHLVESMFFSENKDISSHVHIDAAKDYTSFYCYQEGGFMNHMPLAMTASPKEDIRRIRHRLNVIASNLSENPATTLNSTNTHLYNYIEKDDAEFDGEIKDDNSHDRINALVAQTKKNKRSLNLIRIQNPFLLDVLRSKTSFMKIAAIFLVIIFLYTGFNGVIYYLNEQQYSQLQAEALAEVKKVSPQSKSIKAALRSTSKLRDELYSNWENRIDLTYRSYYLSEFMKKVDEVRQKVANAELQTMRYEDNYVEYTGTIKNIEDVDKLKELSQEKFTDYNVDIEQKNIGGTVTFTLKLTKKGQKEINEKNS